MIKTYSLFKFSWLVGWLVGWFYSLSRQIFFKGNPNSLIHLQQQVLNHLCFFMVLFMPPTWKDLTQSFLLWGFRGKEGWELIWAHALVDNAGHRISRCNVNNAGLW